MSQKGKNLIKNTLLFSVGNAGAKLLMLVIVPLYTYYVSTEQMGQYDVTYTYINLFAPLACLALHEGIYRWLLDEEANKKDVLRTGLTLLGVLLLASDVIAFVILSAIRYAYTAEFILLLDATGLYTTAQFTTRGMRNNRIYAVQGIVYSLALIGCNLILVIWLRLQARGLLWSMTIAALVTTLFMFIVQGLWRRHAAKGKFSRPTAADLIRYSVPIVPNNIAWWLVSASNRLVINWYMGDAANGIYAIAMKFPTMVSMLATFFYQAWQEQAITEYSSRDRDMYYSRVFNLYVRLLLTGIIVLLPATKFVIQYWMDASYADASRYVGLLYLSSVMNAFAAFYGTGYMSVKKTAGALTTTVYGALANVVISVVLMRSAGLYAAALGSLLGNAAIWITRIIQTKKYFVVHVNWGIFVMLLALCVGSMMLVNQITGIVALLVFEAAVGILFIAVNRELITKVFKTLLPFVIRKKADEK